MALPNSSITSPDAGTGVEISTHDSDSKTILAALQAQGINALLLCDIPTYVAYDDDPAQFWEQSAGDIAWQIFNGTGSGAIVLVLGVYFDIYYTYTGTTARDSYDVKRRSAEGTRSVDLTAVPLDTNNPALPSQIHISRGITGGTTGATLYRFETGGEFGNANNTIQGFESRVKPVDIKFNQPMILREGEGICGVAVNANAANYANYYRFVIAVIT